MKETIEKELKYVLDKNSFFVVKKYFDSCEATKQINVLTNYYFDTTAYMLRNKGISLRLRETDSTDYSLTMKIKNAEISEHVHNKKEFNINLDYDLFNTLKNTKNFSAQREVPDFIKNILKNEECEVNLIGSLTTRRTSYKLVDMNEPILLDESTYLDTTDYELEWETDEINLAKKRILHIFYRLGIATQTNSASKSQRYINRHKSLLSFNEKHIT